MIQRYRHKMPWPARSYFFYLVVGAVYEAAEGGSSCIEIAPGCKIVIKFVPDSSLILNDNENVKVAPDEKQIVLAHMELLLRLSPSRN